MKLSTLFEQAQITYYPPGKPVLNSIIDFTDPMTVYEDYDGDDWWSTTVSGKCMVTGFICDDYDDVYDENYYRKCDDYEHCDYVGLTPLSDPDSIYWARKYDLEKRSISIPLLLTWKEVLH